METENNPEIDIFDLDWSSLSENDKKKIIDGHINYVDASRKTVRANGSYVANMRSLILMLLVSLIMSIQGVENRIIVLTITSVQFAKTVLSRLFEASLQIRLHEIKKEITQFLTRKFKMQKNV